MDIHSLAELYIFETLPREQRLPRQRAWWRAWENVQHAKQVPFAFASGLRRTSDLAILAIAIIIGATTRAPGLTIAGMELLFLGTGALLIYSRTLQRFMPAVGVYLVVLILGILLNLLFPGTWGSVGPFMLVVILLYRFPLSWSLPLACLCIITFITTDGALRLLLDQQPAAFIYNMLGACSLGWFGWTQRRQYLLIVRLHETQEQLREQMARSKALAAEQERTRIARDIHDVLSHSLAVLSIQVQAARQLLARDPERLATKLDDMATLIRESISESRSVVGLLREQTPLGHDDLAASLRSIASTFNERTGIHCRFEETGAPRPVNAQQRETLQLALREMLTNAHRHGAARTVWITLRWQTSSILLEARDDGVGMQAAQPDTIEDGTLEAGKADGTGGHHGLQGMRERATALGGQVEAAPAEAGGFEVSLSLPYEQNGARLVKRGSERE